MNITQIIRKSLDLPISEDIELYKDPNKRKFYTEKISNIVNQNVNKINYPYDKNIFNEVFEDGYCVVENFLSQSEVDLILNQVSSLKGYQFHIPNRSFNQKPEFFSDNLDWHVCSYKTNNLLTNSYILNLLTSPKIVSIAQEYLGCLPSLTTVNMWWSKFTHSSFHTEQLHRDYNDFKFLTFFIYLTDVTDENGPHVYYKNTHDGSNNLNNKVIVKGKAGTAIFGDTYALHHGSPLKSGKRLILSVRYTLHKNNNFYRDKDYNYELPENMFFDLIDDNDTNRHLLHAFIKEQNT